VKRCRICGAEKPLDEMVWVARKRRGRVEPSRPTTTCKVCNRAHAKAWREQNPERRKNAPAIAAYKRRQKKQRRYGMTADALDYAEILRRDPCAYCGGSSGHADHIDPVSKSGPSTWDNLTAACKSCNSRKKAKPLLLALLYAAR
jgi:5-methylcytosine-specific restriction endonuclease McrA